MVNIKDIAQKAGVSISTVSYALNGNTRVSEKTRSRILEIANDLNYIPNAAGRNLKKKETKVIGAFINDYTAPIFGQILQGMREALNAHDYELVVCSGIKSHRFIPERMFDGAVILDISFPSEKIMEYASRGHKMVVLDRELDHPNIQPVLLDNQNGAKLAIEYLIQKGHQKLYIVKGPENNFDNRKRLQSARQVVSHHLHVDYTEISGDFDKESGKRAAQQIVQEYREPVAVFCFNDEMAIGMYHDLLKTNLRIGEHIHIIGFDNIELSKYIQPTLTTIGYSRQHWGKVAAEQLLNMINEQPLNEDLISVKLIEGKSVGERLQNSL
ncbi:LacI family DNA-binding transcriptional regulator [Lederbergia galactosidilytica]|uniref:LacI family transcriptional regulator n=1 Tax=Lederbergia galactosidilytica TaxID=217031 RepID=A0A177ZGQ9_9BACI|nr:LacI family DNA-binding transcriptional regulator [Lederbergia galactosidilytica]OAK67102.1 LacI family transcriptional regulator [Lederbergia galactosidilytica]